VECPLDFHGALPWDDTTGKSCASSFTIAHVSLQGGERDAGIGGCIPPAASPAQGQLGFEHAGGGVLGQLRPALAVYHVTHLAAQYPHGFLVDHELPCDGAAALARADGPADLGPELAPEPSAPPGAGAQLHKLRVQVVDSGEGALPVGGRLAVLRNYYAEF